MTAEPMNSAPPAISMRCIVEFPRTRRAETVCRMRFPTGRRYRTSRSIAITPRHTGALSPAARSLLVPAYSATFAMPRNNGCFHSGDGQLPAHPICGVRHTNFGASYFAYSWYRSLVRLRDDEALRRGLGAAGRTSLRKAAARTIEAICAAIGELLGTFTAEECANYFINSGYAPT
jgi:hypothetical protein